MNSRTENEKGLPELLGDVRLYLRWQKQSLGLSGIPKAYLKSPERRNATGESTQDSTTVEPELQDSVKPDIQTASNMKTAVTAPVDMFAEKENHISMTLEEIRAEIGDCRRCKLNSTRTNIVFGEGNPKARIMFIGEGPGHDEDMSGRPFVGRAGKLLTQAIENGMGIPRSEVYIANIVKCRPPENRDPEQDEADACLGFVKKQIRAIKPEVIILLGRIPLLHILGEKTGITKVHGEWYKYEGIPTMPVFHPSYLLRSPGQKRPFWEDLKKIMLHLGMSIPARNAAGDKEQGE